MTYPILSTNSRLYQALDQFKPINVLVIGDVIIDRYHHGVVERISQEAPIPVLLVKHEEDRLGGAASVANNLVALGCKVSLAGLIGDDKNKTILQSLLTAANINGSLVYIDKEFTTILKTRYVAQNQQLVRVDYESSYHFTDALAEKISDSIIENISNFQAVAISDYGKGFLHPIILQKVINSARYHGIPCICDPKKHADFSHYFGVTTIKPNRVETEAFVGFKIDNQMKLLAAAKMIQEKVGAQFLSISLDKAGILYYRNESDYNIFPADTKEVFDVSGAGDMVTTILTAFSNCDPKIAISIANIAAGIVVSKLGGISVSLKELKHSLMPKLYSKIISWEQLKVLRNKDHAQKWTFTNGYFDNLNASQIIFLQKTADIGDIRVVAINSDNSVIRQKGIKPILNQQLRAELLASLHSVDWVFIFDDEEVSELIQKLKPDFVVKGSNFKDKQLAEMDAIEEVGAELIFVAIVTDIVN